MGYFQSLLFRKIHGAKLIYNTCWEDPRCDREMLKLDSDSKVVMITSAGDNLLDYLLDDPAEIHSVDMNFRQNALFEIKRSIYLNGDHEHLFKFFGNGQLPDARKYYEENLRSFLPHYAQDYWDNHINYFEGKGKRSTFYYRGASGALAYICRSYLSMRKKLRTNVENLLAADTLSLQAEYYSASEAKIFSPVVNLLLNNHFTMCLAGVPKAQQMLMQEMYEGGNADYIRECLRNVFTKLEIGDNYFYQVYLNGKYTEECCPEYLKQENFLPLRNNESKVTTYSSTLNDFLQKNPGKYSHFVLLDHQDWLAANDIQALQKEWELILENSRPGTKILMRSAALEVDFFPYFLKDKIYFDDETTKKSHAQDRVGTYASVYLAIVK